MGKRYSPKAINFWGAEFRIAFLHAVITSIVGALFILNGNFNFSCESHFFIQFLGIFILHLAALLAWYVFELETEKKIEKGKEKMGRSGVDKNLCNRAKLYTYLFPTFFFLSVVVASFLPSAFLSIFLVCLFASCWIRWCIKKVIKEGKEPARILFSRIKKYILGFYGEKVISSLHNKKKGDK